MDDKELSRSFRSLIDGLIDKAAREATGEGIGLDETPTCEDVECDCIEKAAAYFTNAVVTQEDKELKKLLFLVNAAFFFKARATNDDTRTHYVWECCRRDAEFLIDQLRGSNLAITTEEILNAIGK